MNKIFFVALMASVFTLTACDSAAQKKQKKCTEIYNTVNDYVMSTSKEDRAKYSSAMKDWDEYQCHQSDVITH